MFQRHIVRAGVRVSILGVIGMSLTLIEPQMALANCGGHCQVMKRCAELVKEKGTPKGAAFQSEFNKCMTDSANYK